MKPHETYNVSKVIIQNIIFLYVTDVNQQFFFISQTFVFTLDAQNKTKATIHCNKIQSNNEFWKFVESFMSIH